MGYETGGGRFFKKRPPPDPHPQNFTFIESLFAAFPVGLLGLWRGREQGFYGLGGLEGRITFRKTW